MRKTHKLWVAVVAMITAVFMVGCSGLTGVQFSDNSNDDGTVTLNAAIQNFLDFEKPVEVSEGRSILPETRVTNYNYFLYGESTKGDFIVVEPATVTTGSFTRAGITPGTWEFTLFALPKTGASYSIPGTAPTTLSDAQADAAAAKAAASLVAYAFCDLRNDDGNATFTLSSDSLNGNGEIDLMCYLSDDQGTTSWFDVLPTGATIVATIRNMITDAEIATSSITLDFASLSDAKTGCAYTIATFKPGTYNFVVDIKTSAGKMLQSWSDTITVVTNRKTAGSVYIPNLIGTKPANVAGLTAVYIKDSEDLASHNDKYKVQFTWTNTPVNEEYYELQVAEISKAAAAESTIGTYKWKKASTSDTTISVYSPSGEKYEDEEASGANEMDSNATFKKLHSNTDSPEYVAGSLNRNNTSVVLSLDLGKRYIARIRALNSVGASAWTNLILTDGKGAATLLNTAHATYLAAIAADPNDATALTTFEGDFATAPISLICGADGGTTPGTTAYFVDNKTTPDLSDAINRFRITYHVAGGSYGNAGGAIVKSDRSVYYTVEAGATAASPTNTGYDLWDGTELKASTQDLLLNGDSRKPLVNWVLYDYFDSPLDATKVVWTSGGTNTPYKGFANYDVYATYSGSTYTLTGGVNEEVDLSEYVLYTKWFDINSTALGTGTEVSYSKTFTQTQRASGLPFGVTVPTATLPEMYDSITMTVRKADGEILRMAKLDSLTAGTRATFATIDMSKWDNGKYMVEYVATKKLPGITDTVIRKVNVALTFTD